MKSNLQNFDNVVVIGTAKFVKLGELSITKSAINSVSVINNIRVDKEDKKAEESL